MSASSAESSCLGCGAPLPPERPHFPFCSLRCRAADLHDWLSGAHQPPGLLDEEGDG